MELKQIGKQSRKNSFQNQIKQPLKILAAKYDIQQKVDECVKKIVNKMNDAKIQTLHPAYFGQTLTPFRQQCYNLFLKNEISEKLKYQKSFKDGLNVLEKFIEEFDDQYVDNYMLLIKQPYTRKIFNQGYEIDKVNFRKLNSQYELRKQINQVLSQTSEWLIQIQLLEDILSRIELYFDIQYKSIMQKVKTKGASDRKGGWGDYLVSLFRKTSSYGLRKCSKVVQNSYYASLLSPAFTILTWAIIGGSSTLPWSGGIDIKSFMIPAIAFTVPYLLDYVAEGIQRKDFQVMLNNWTLQFTKINDCFKHFNLMLINEINSCTSANTYDNYLIHRTNLQKYIETIEKNVQKVSNFQQKDFAQLKQRTEAYYKKYIQVEEEGGWINVYTPQEYEKENKQL